MYDRDNSNQVTEHELMYILQELGQSRSQAEVKALLEIYSDDIGPRIGSINIRSNR